MREKVDATGVMGDGGVEGLMKMIAALSHKFDKVDSKMDMLGDKVDGLEVKFTSLESDVESIKKGQKAESSQAEDNGVGDNEKV